MQNHILHEITEGHQACMQSLNFGRTYGPAYVTETTKPFTNTKGETKQVEVRIEGKDYDYWKYFHSKATEDLGDPKHPKYKKR